MRLFNRPTAKADILANADTAAAYWRECPVDQPAETLDELRQHLDEQTVRGRVLGAANMQALLYLDAAAAPLFERVGLQFLQNARMPQTWQTEQLSRMGSYVNAVLKSYLAFLQDVPTALHGSKPALPALQMGLIIARGLRFLGLASKLDYYQNQIPDQKLWRIVHRLYRMAEQLGVARNLVAGGFTPTTCEDEWLKVNMLATVNQGSLKPRQVEQVYLWLDALSVHLVPEQQPDPRRHQYYADLQGGGPARRFMSESVNGEARFWGTSELLYRLAENRKALQANQMAALSGLASHELYQRLEKWWTPEVSLLDLRAHERLLVEGERLVAGGLEPILQLLQKSPLARRGEHVDVWPLRDMSDNGLGLAVRANHPWARLTYLFLVGEDRQPWRLAVLRRLVFEHGATQGQVGLQWLANTPQLVRIENAGLGGGVRGGLWGIYVAHGASTEANPGALVIPAALYRAGTLLGLSPPDAPSLGLFQLDDLLVQGDDWAMVKISERHV